MNSIFKICLRKKCMLIIDIIERMDNQESKYHAIF